MIGVDWGTSSFRAFRLGAQDAILDRIDMPKGILHVERPQFPAVLQAAIGPWLAAGERHVLLSGMVGSRQGWQEAPYLPCPAGAAEIAAALTAIAFDGATVKLAPGLSDVDETGTPEVMRGEETQIIGALGHMPAGTGIACLPGSHSKWARIADGRILGYRTYLSGEAFAALRGGTILGRMMTDGPPDPAAFARGVTRAGAAGHLLHHLFGVRTLGLTGQLADSGSASYLSGLLIGHEVRAALPADATVYLIGAPALCALYARAIEACGGVAVIVNEDAAARGLAAIGKATQWD